MTVSSEIIKYYPHNFQGLDRRASDLVRNRNCAQVARNVQVDRKGRFTKRKGFHTTDNGMSLSNFDINKIPHNYTYWDSSTGGTKEELITLSLSLASVMTVVKIATGRLRVRYVGAGAAGTIAIYSDGSTDTFYVDLRVNGSSISGWPKTYANTWEYDDKTLTDVQTDIDAEADFTASLIYDGGSPSLAAPLVGAVASFDYTDCKTANLDLEFLYTGVTQPTGSTFTIPIAISEVGYIPPSMLNLQNVLYIAGGYYLWKYDGLRFYRAGMPEGVFTSVAGGGAGAVFPIDGVWRYKVVYKRLDYRNNIIEGADSDDSLTTAEYTASSAQASLTLTIPNITNSDYLPRGAIVNGNQAATTSITVDAGHTVATGDVIYFYNTATSAYVTRTVTATTATTITFVSAVSVNDNQVISNNIRIQIYRTKDAGDDFYLVEEVPNDALNTNYTYSDTKADTALGAIFVEQERKFDLPPKCSVMCVHQNHLILSGDPDNPNTVYFSDLIGGPEAFPEASNSVDIKPLDRGVTTAVVSDSNAILGVFKESSHTQIVGDLDSLTFQVVENTKSNIGCVSHKTLTKLGRTQAVIGLSNQGPFLLKDGSITVEVGDPILPDFQNQFYDQVSGTAITTAQESLKVLRRAVAIDDYRNERYLLFVPCETGTPNDYVYANSNSRIYVFDYGNPSPHWVEWTFVNKLLDMNMGAGFCIYRNRLIWSSRSYIVTNLGATVMRSHLFEEASANTVMDYFDNVYPTSFDLMFQWFDDGEPSQPKKINDLKVYRNLLPTFGSPEPTPSNTAFSIEVETYKDYNASTSKTDTTRSFSATESEKTINPAYRKFRSLALRIKSYTTSITPAAYQNTEISGIEMEVLRPYKKEVKDARSK